jgi:uncharacterized membrane protein
LRRAEEAAPSRLLLFACSAAIAFGTLSRIYLTFAKPLWADEVFTLDLARKSAGEILRVLAVDSGPPLHYLLVKLVLLPFPEPGRGDVLVRALSLAASLLTLPVLVSIGRRLGSLHAGLGAAALLSISPLAADFAAEGRGYALAGLLSLLALREALRIREEPSYGRAVLAGLLAAVAVLTHYLALFAVAGLAALLLGATREAKRALALAGGVLALALSPWALVALRQPRASMAWARATPPGEALSRFAIDLALSFDAAGPRVLLLACLALLLFAALLVVSFRGPLRPVAAVLVAGLVALLAAQLATGALVLPERTAMPFLPLVSLLLAGAPLPISLPVAAAAFLALAVKLPASRGTSSSEALAQALLPAARRGQRICAVGLWGPELDYRLRAAGLQGRVVLFPSDVARHRGWYTEDGGDGEGRRYESEAEALVARREAELFVLPFGSRAADALRAALAPRRPVRRLASPLFEVVAAPR